MSTHHEGGHDHFASLMTKSRSAMIVVLSISLVYMLAEVIGGYLTGSLALLADAGHMLSDVGALVLALVANWFASRPATKANTYGYLRMEILAALTNAVLLVLISGFIMMEAYQRFSEPSEILTGPMLAVATGGLVLNLISMRILAPSSEHSLNVKAAYLEVVADMLGSVAVIVAGLLIMWTGWTGFDPIVSIIIGLAILPRTWRLIKESVHILMEGTPARIELDKLSQEILAVEGVKEIHDLHVWTITSSKDALSAHVVVDRQVQAEAVLAAITSIARDRYQIHHTTIQVEQLACTANSTMCRQ